MAMLIEIYKKLRIFLGLVGVLGFSGALHLHGMDHDKGKAQEAQEGLSSTSSEIVPFGETQEVLSLDEAEELEQEELNELIKRLKGKPEKSSLLQWLLKKYSYLFQGAANEAPRQDMFGSTLTYGDGLGTPESMRTTSAGNVSANSLRNPRRNSSWSSWFMRMIAYNS